MCSEFVRCDDTYLKGHSEVRLTSHVAALEISVPLDFNFQSHTNQKYDGGQGNGEGRRAP